MVLQLLYWLVGQGFGGIFQGGATDPNAAPLFILLAYIVDAAEALPAPAPHRSHPPRVDHDRSRQACARGRARCVTAARGLRGRRQDTRRPRPTTASELEHGMAGMNMCQRLGHGGSDGQRDQAGRDPHARDGLLAGHEDPGADDDAGRRSWSSPARQRAEFKPPKDSSFHLMVMLTDRHTDFRSRTRASGRRSPTAPARSSTTSASGR